MFQLPFDDIEIFDACVKISIRNYSRGGSFSQYKVLDKCRMTNLRHTVVERILVRKSKGHSLPEFLWVFYSKVIVQHAVSACSTFLI